MKLIICISLFYAIWLMIADVHVCSAQAAENHYEEREMLHRALKNEFPRASSKILAPFLDIPRHRFVRGNIQSLAYQDMDLPVGTNTIIPAPSLVLKIIDTVKLEKKHSVLIIGRGTGYMGAVMCEIADRVSLVELDGGYYGTLISVIESLELENCELFGSLGLLPGFGNTGSRKYDRIIIHAGVREVPVRITSMLAEEGELIVPLTGDSGFQSLLHLRTAGGVEIESIGESFFPFAEGLY